jgi:hypothetical protein
LSELADVTNSKSFKLERGKLGNITQIANTCIHLSLTTGTITKLDVARQKAINITVSVYNTIVRIFNMNKFFFSVFINLLLTVNLIYDITNLSFNSLLY